MTYTNHGSVVTAVNGTIICKADVVSLSKLKRQ